MRILIDGDGCPVVDIAVRLCRQEQVPCLILCDTAHRLEQEGARTIVVDQGADSVDFALVNLLEPGDGVITQDYGLASMCLARGARVLRQDGMEYNEKNIDTLLELRYAAARIRRGGGRLRGPKKRTPQQDRDFEAKFLTFLREASGENSENRYNKK